MKKLFLFFAAAFITSTSLFAQVRRSCATYEHMIQQLAADPAFAAKRQEIEGKTSDFLRQGGLNRATQRGAVVYTIPVVVHVVYNTTAQNISDAQIQSQIDVLNRDYQFLNTDVTKIPSAFAGLAADCQINFCLAQRTSTGAATTGIVRKSTTKTSFTTNDAVKSSSTGGDNAWDATKYLNLWVCNLSGGVLGYAQFPGGAAATDGVVITYTGFGTSGTAAAPFNLGRTATHEIGHWLNLHHIWGDDGTACSGSDLVDDTPNQADENYGCPTFPSVSCSNGPNGDMFMNYMDYSDDACMYMFTNGQKARMYALFSTGGARAAIVNNNLGCAAPTQTACGVPTSVTATNITTASATIGWSAVSGATSYTLQYKTSATSAYTSVTATSTSYSLTGLIAATTYNYQISANCSSGSSAYSTIQNFTTQAAPSCTTPSGLAAANITSTSAVISWTAVSGASSYTLQYKLASASAFTSVNSSLANYSLTGLTPGTAYNYQVRANCSSGNSAYTQTQSLTTQSAACTDNYEPNNTSATATALTVNTSVAGLISSTSDVDYFNFSNTATQKNIRISLTNLPQDYDVKLYSPSGSQVAVSQNSGTASEAISYNTSVVGTYKLQVYGFNHAFSASSCYALNVQLSSSTTREETRVNDSKVSVRISPVPASSSFNLVLNSFEKGAVEMVISSQNGAIVLRRRMLVSEGLSTEKVDVSKFANGLYIVKTWQGKTIYTDKLVVQH